MKQCYEKPELAVIEFTVRDVICTSFTTDEGGGLGGSTGWDQG